MARGWQEEDYQRLLRERDETYPLGRIGEPSDFAEAVQFFDSDRARWKAARLQRWTEEARLAHYPCGVGLLDLVVGTAPRAGGNMRSCASRQSGMGGKRLCTKLIRRD